jgi:hypothetical protein
MSASDSKLSSLKAFIYFGKFKYSHGGQMWVEVAKLIPDFIGLTIAV